MIPFRTASQFIPPWCSCSISILHLLEVIYPFRAAFADTLSNPVNSSGSALFLIFTTSDLDFYQVRKAKRERCMGDSGQSSRAGRDLTET
jgi:hypothetical protein